MRNPFCSQLVGPLFRFELLRLARSGRFFLLRCLYALALLLVLWLVYQSLAGYWEFRAFFETNVDTRGQLGRLAEQFSLTILIVQNVAVFILAPLYLAPSIIAERERGTLDLLFTTHLRSHEIILGKYLARSVILGSVLLGGLPVLALVHFLGGVNLWLVLGGFLITAITILSTASIGIYSSAYCRKTIDAVFWSYGFLLLLSASCCMVGSPFFALLNLDAGLRGQGDVLSIILPSQGNAGPLEVTIRSVARYAVFHFFIVILFLAAAVYNLRAQPLNIEQILFHPTREKATAQSKVPPDATPAGPVVRHFFEIEDDPLWRKESRDKDNLLGTIYFVLALTFFLFFIFLIVFLVLNWMRSPYPASGPALESLNQALRSMFIVSLTGICALEALRTAGCLSREREQRTLESLLTIPQDRSELLRIKLLAGCWHMRKGLAAVALYLLLGMMGAAIHPLAGVLSLVAGIIHVLFFAILGLWLSMICRSTLQAHLSLGAVVFALIVGPWLMLPPGLLGWQVVFNPLACWHALAFGWEEFAEAPDLWGRIRLCLLGLLIYSLVGGLLWGWTCHLFMTDPLRENP